MGLFSRRGSNKDGLDAPGSLPDALPEKYGVLSSDSGSSEKVDHRKIPEDIVVRGSGNVGKLPESLAISSGSSPVGGSGVGENVSLGSGRSAHSFFGELEKRLEERKSGLGEHVSRDLVGVMKDFHESRASGKHFFLSEEDVDDSLYKKMLELKELEEEWLVRAREFSAAKELLLEKELEIESKSEVLKSLLWGADKFRLFNKGVSAGEAFRLCNGVLLYSLSDLVRVLPSMDDSVFSHHVSGHRNDFADWVLHVFGDKRLSEGIRDVSSRDALISVLKDY